MSGGPNPLVEYAKAMDANRKSIQEKMYFDNNYKNWYVFVRTIISNITMSYLIYCHYALYIWLTICLLSIWKYKRYKSEVLLHELSNDEQCINCNSNEQSIQKHFHNLTHFLSKVESSLKIHSNANT